MNLAAQLHMSDECTVWPVSGTDEYGSVTYGAPYKFKCAWLSGGRLTMDDKGNQFVPAQTFRSFDQRPKRNDVIIRGDYTGTASPDGLNGAYPIRKIVSKTPFQSWQQRYTFLVG